MADSIILKKLPNTNVIVTKDGIDILSRNPDAIVQKDVSRNQCIVKHKDGGVVDTFPVDEVEKVIRADATEIAISDLDTLFTELTENFFFKLSPKNANHSHLGNFDDYDDLTTQYPTATLGDQAYVLNSQGTSWLPGGLGGTFYSKGIYVWTGVLWDSNLDDISAALQDTIPVEDTVDPTSNDDSTQGYKNGKHWINTTSKESFYLVDNTAGSAIWTNSAVDVENLPIIDLTSTDNTSTIIQSTPTILNWDVETEKDSPFSHSNTVNNSRIVIDEDGTYQINANIRTTSAEQRTQFVIKILIDGVVQSQPYGSAYIRNAGASSDFWTCTATPSPLKLNSGQYVEIQIQIESQITSAATGTFQGSDSSFSIISLSGAKGEKGDTGSGSNIIIQENDSTVGTVVDTLNFEGGSSVVDEGSGKATVISEKYYHERDTNTGGGTVDAAFDSLIECVPTSGTLEVEVPEDGVYIIGGKVDIGTDLNKDNGAIQLMYGIDGTMGPLSDAILNQHAKKNKSNGIQGTWGNVSLNSGETITLFLSTLDDSATWLNGDIWIATWK